MSLDATQLSGIAARLEGLRRRLTQTKALFPEPTRGAHVWTEDGEQCLAIAERLLEEVKAR